MLAALVGVGAEAVAIAASPAGSARWNEAAVGAVIVAYAVVGLVIVWHRPGHPIGRLALAIAAVWGVAEALVATSYAALSDRPGRAARGARVGPRHLPAGAAVVRRRDVAAAPLPGRAARHHSAGSLRRALHPRHDLRLLRRQPVLPDADGPARRAHRQPDRGAAVAGAGLRRPGRRRLAAGDRRGGSRRRVAGPEVPPGRSARPAADPHLRRRVPPAAGGHGRQLLGRRRPVGVRRRHRCRCRSRSASPSCSAGSTTSSWRSTAP